MGSRRKDPVEARRRRIIELTTEAAYLRPTEIADQLNVSGETVRRDLLALERAGELRRVHGGAMASNVHSSEPDRRRRSESLQDEKRQIGRIVAGLLEPDDTVFMDVGTTVEAVAGSLPEDFVGTVVTNSLAVGSILNERDRLELFVAGGRVRLGEMSTYGPDTLAFVGEFHAAVAVIGSGGVHPETGLTDYSVEDIALKRLMIERASRSYIVATGDKLGMQAKRFVCSLHDVDGVITDLGAPAAVVEALRAQGVDVLVSESGDEGLPDQTELPR